MTGVSQATGGQVLYRGQPIGGRSSGALRFLGERVERLEQRRGQAAGTMSGGERQRLAVGRALMGKPRLLMLDR